MSKSPEVIGKIWGWDVYEGDEIYHMAHGFANGFKHDGYIRVSTDSSFMHDLQYADITEVYGGSKMSLLYFDNPETVGFDKARTPKYRYLDDDTKIKIGDSLWIKEKDSNEINHCIVSQFIKSPSCELIYIVGADNNDVTYNLLTEVTCEDITVYTKEPETKPLYTTSDGYEVKVGDKVEIWNNDGHFTGTAIVSSLHFSIDTIRDTGCNHVPFFKDGGGNVYHIRKYNTYKGKHIKVGDEVCLYDGDNNFVDRNKVASIVAGEIKTHEGYKFSTDGSQCRTDWTLSLASMFDWSTAPHWNEAQDGYNYWAIDEDGLSHYFHAKPIIRDDHWYGRYSTTMAAGYRNDLKEHLGDWKNSLQKRPKAEQ